MGEGVQKAQTFWGEVQTDKSMNDVLSKGDTIIDNYKKLNGQDALNAQQSTHDQLQQLVDQGRANLSSPQQQLQYDQQVRNYQQRYWAGQMSAHSLQQSRVVAENTNNDSYKLAINRVATADGDPGQIRSAWDDAYSARVKQLHFEGLDTPQGLADARIQSGRDIYATAAKNLAVKDPVRAQRFIEDNREALGAEYAPLADGVRSRAIDQGGRDLATSSRQAAEQAAAGAPTSPARPEAAPLPTFATMAAPGAGGQAPAQPTTAPNALPQEGPIPPARGDGMPVAAPGAGTVAPAALADARPVSDSSALLASQRISLGREQPGDRDLLARYHVEQNTPPAQRQNTVHLPPGQNVPLPPPRAADGSIVQPPYAAWRGTLSKDDRVQFDRIALRDATSGKIPLPQAQAALYKTISDRATARGQTLDGGTATSAQPAAPAQGQPSPATAAQQPLQDLPPALATPQGKDPRFVYLPQKDAADRIIASKTASAADKASARAVVDRWNSQSFAQPGLKTTADQDKAAGRALGPVPAPDTSDHTSYPTLMVNPKTGRADTSGAPEIDRSHVAPAAAAPRPPGRDTSAAPVAHPATLQLPAAPTHDAADTSHSLPRPVGGSPALSYFTTAGAPYGISGSYLARTAQIESGGKGNVTSPTGAAGVFQFIPSTWARYGNGGNPYDYGANTMAAVRLAADNRSGLTRALGREPTDAELYLAHQQGLAGASALLRNPGMVAADALAPAYQGNRAVAARAIAVNGGDPNGTAGAFAQKWINKFNGVAPKGGNLPFFAQGAGGFGTGAYAATATPLSSPAPFANTVPDSIAAPLARQAPAPEPTTPQPTLLQQAGSGSQAPPPPPVEAQPQHSVAADTYARIEASGESPEVKARAFAMARQQFAEDQMADEQNTAARKARSEKARDGYVQRLLLGDTAGMLQQVARDPNLEPETRWTLGQAVEKHSADLNGGENPKAWGPGFGAAYERLMLPAGDPNRLQSSDQIYHLAGPEGRISLAGAAKLDGVFKAMQRSADDHNVETAKASVIHAMHERMSFESPDVHLRDRRGEDAFNTKFMPQYLAAFDAHVKANKDPWEFLNDTKSAEALADRLRPRQQMEADRLAALNGDGTPGTGQTAPNPFGAGGEVLAPAEPPPQPNPRIPAPAGTNADGWSAVMTNLPPSAPGQRPFTADDWAAAVQRLAADPSPDTIARWNSSKLGRAGYDAAAVLRYVRPDVRVAPPPAPAMTLDLGQMGP